MVKRRVIGHRRRTRKGITKVKEHGRTIKSTIILRENPREENGNVALWFEDKTGKYMASVVRGEYMPIHKDYEVFGRMTADGKRLPQIHFQGALFGRVKERKKGYADRIEQHYKRNGYKVRIIVR